MTREQLDEFHNILLIPQEWYRREAIAEFLAMHGLDDESNNDIYSTVFGRRHPDENKLTRLAFSSAMELLRES